MALKLSDKNRAHLWWLGQMGLMLQIGDITIHAIAAAHEFLDEDENGLYPYLQYIIEGNGVRIHHAGETGSSFVIPGHWDMFAANSEDPMKFADYISVKYPYGPKCILPKVMEEIAL